MRVNDGLHSGDAVLCMPRDLFKEAGHSGITPALAGGLHESSRALQEEEEKRGSQGIAMQGLRFLLPAVHALDHHANSVQVLTSSIGNHWPLVPYERICCDSGAKGNNASSPALFVDAGSTPSPASRQWCFQVIASLRANRSSLSSDVIAAIDFDETGSRFATGGIARKIRVCSYTALLSNHERHDASQVDRNTGAEDDFGEDRQLLGPNSRGRSCRSLRSSCGSKRKNVESEDLFVDNHDDVALRIICTPAKLSSLKWRPFGASVVGCGDYDGVVTEWDVEQGLCLSERYEHSGQRIWSVDYSRWFPTLCASASGDGTVRLWTLNCEKSVGIIRSPGRNSICSAEFSAEGPHRVAVACADSNVYVYDVRRLDSSLLCLQGHERAASYVRFLGSEELVSASIDSSVKLWDVSTSNALCLHGGRQNTLSDTGTASRGTSSIEVDLKRRFFNRASDDGMYRLRRTFTSHRNVKNFVGLSVWKEAGLIACGSESNQVFVYDKMNEEPVWRMKFSSESVSAQRRRQRMEEEEERDELEEIEEGRKRVEESKCFVGAVCWQQHSDHHSLLAANSEGTLQLVKVT